MVGIGIVGIGFMGMIHYLAAAKAAGARVVALCSRDPKKLAGDWTSIQGNFGPRGTQMDLSGVALLPRLRRPAGRSQRRSGRPLRPQRRPWPDGHPGARGRQARPGREADRAQSTRRPTRWSRPPPPLASCSWSGHVLPFFPEFAFALEAVQSGRYGALRAAHLMRVISKPDWSSGIADPARSGGPAIDLHIHDTHFIGLICGSAASCPLARGRRERGRRPPDDAVSLRHTQPGCLLRSPAR